MPVLTDRVISCPTFMVLSLSGRMQVSAGKYLAISRHLAPRELFHLSAKKIFRPGKLSRNGVA
jgi:hypothetical protein